jgi:hypothetical protein
MMELLEEVTAEVVIVNVAVVEAAATTTLVWTCAAAVLLLARVTVAPPLSAGPLSVTVPCDVLPPNTLVGFSVTDATVGEAEIVSERIAVSETAGLSESVTLKVREALVTDTEGVPVIAPVEPFSERPVGSEPPASVHV